MPYLCKINSRYYQHIRACPSSGRRRRHPKADIEPLKSAEPDPAPDELPAITAAEASRHAEAVAAQRAAFRQALEERLGVMVPSEDPDAAPEGEAWPAWRPAHREAILQPPKPEIRPAPQVERRAEMEAEPG